MHRALTRLRPCLVFATLALTTGCSLGPLEPEWRQQQDTLRISRPPRTLTTEQERPVMTLVAR